MRSRCLVKINRSSRRACSRTYAKGYSILGKFLDQGVYYEFIGKIFAQSQRLANDQDYMSIHKEVYVSLLLRVCIVTGAYDWAITGSCSASPETLESLSICGRQPQ
jgi:hypothetical protein